MVPAGLILANAVIIVTALRFLFWKPPERSVAIRDTKIWIVVPLIVAVSTLIGIAVDRADRWDHIIFPVAAVAILLQPIAMYLTLRHLVPVRGPMVLATCILSAAAMLLYFAGNQLSVWQLVLLVTLAVTPYIIGSLELAPRARSGVGIAAMRQRYGIFTIAGMFIVVLGGGLFLNPATKAAGHFTLEAGLLIHAFGISMSITPPARIINTWRASTVFELGRRLHKLANHDAPEATEETLQLMDGLLDTGECHFVAASNLPHQATRHVGVQIEGHGSAGGEVHTVHVGIPDLRLAVFYPKQRVFPHEDLETLTELAHVLRVYIRDIKAREIIHNHLRETKELERTKSEFLRAIGHELSNPLSPLQLQLRILTGKAPDEMARSLQIIERNVSRLKALVENLQDVARLQDAQVDLQCVPIRLDQTVSELLLAMRPMAEQKHLRMQSVVEPTTIEGDPGKISQIVTNLISNAIKYTPRGTIEVRVGHQGENAVLEVCDTGLGMTPEQISQLGNAYARFHRAGDIPGTGLGVFVTKGLIEAHDGNLEVHSEGPGKGTCFRVLLPSATMRHKKPAN